MPAFDKALLANVNIKIDQMAADANLRKQYQPQIEALRIVQQNQTASLNPVLNELTRADKNLEGKVYVNWLTANSLVVEAVEENCNIDGPGLDSDNKPYDLTMRFKTDFSYDEDQLKNTIYTPEEVQAMGFLRAFQLLDEEYAKRVIAKLDAYAGTNQFLGGFTFATGATQVPAASYNVALFPYLAQAAIVNRLTNYYLIDNGSLFAEKFLADAGQVVNGVSNANLYNQFKIAFDLINFAKAAIPTDTLLVDSNSIFFATKTRYTNTVPFERKADQFVYTRRSPFSGIEYDVYAQRRCEVTADAYNLDHMVHTFRIQTKGDLLQAPEATYASVLAFDKV